MRLAKGIDYIHAGRIIAAAEHIYESICSIIITNSNHRIEITVQGICIVCFAELIVVFVNGAHNEQLDQAGSLHRLIVDRAFGAFHKVADVNGPVSIILRKKSSDL